MQTTRRERERDRQTDRQTDRQSCCKLRCNHTVSVIAPRCRIPRTQKLMSSLPLLNIRSYHRLPLWSLELIKQCFCMLRLLPWILPCACCQRLIRFFFKAFLLTVSVFRYDSLLGHVPVRDWNREGKDHKGRYSPQWVRYTKLYSDLHRVLKTEYYLII